MILSTKKDILLQNERARETPPPLFQLNFEEIYTFELEEALATEYGSADDYRRMNPRKITKGPYSIYAFYKVKVCHFLDEASMASWKYSGLYGALQHFFTEFARLVRKSPKVYVSVSRVLSCTYLTCFAYFWMNSNRNGKGSKRRKTTVVVARR